jgi:HEAT repeat protein
MNEHFPTAIERPPRPGRRPRPALRAGLVLALALALGCSSMTRRERLIREASAEPEARDRIDALDELAEYDSPTVRVALESILADDPSPAVRAVAAAKLEKVGNENSVPALKKSFAEDEKPVVRLASFRTLGRLLGPKDAGLLELALERLGKDTDPNVRMRCARWLGMNRYERAVPALVRALDDYDNAVRVGAYWSLVELTGKRDLAPVRGQWENWLKEREAPEPD